MISNRIDIVAILLRYESSLCFVNIFLTLVRYEYHKHKTFGCPYHTSFKINKNCDILLIDTRIISKQTIKVHCWFKHIDTTLLKYVGQVIGPELHFDSCVLWSCANERTCQLESGVLACCSNWELRRCGLKTWQTKNVMHMIVLFAPSMHAPCNPS